MEQQQMSLLRFEEPSESMVRDAELSEDGRYRYSLLRRWNPSLPSMFWVMLNPSKADANIDDATIRRCIGFARIWGYGELRVINLFAWRETESKKLLLVPPEDLVDARNVEVFSEMVDAKPRLIVAAWGNGVPEAHRVYVETVKSTLRFHGARCLGHTKSGEPKHPVRLANATALRPL